MTWLPPQQQQQPPQLDYEAPPRRSLGTWVMLLIAWSLGLVSWTLYGAAAIYLLSKIM